MGKASLLIEVPFHMGMEAVSAGRGPRLLIEAGADAALSYHGMPAEVHHVRLRDAECKDVDAIVDVGRQVAAAVRLAREQEVLPVVLAGNCNSCWGTLAGLQPASTGIVWYDAHPDFHTPATSISGFLDGMALAAAVGHCHQDLTARIGLTRFVDTSRVCLRGIRDVEDGERERVAAYGLGDGAPSEIEAVYLHLDLDFLDRDDCPGVSCRAAGGMRLTAACREVGQLAAALPVAAVGLTNFNPAHDRGGKTVQTALALLRAVSGSPNPGC